MQQTSARSTSSSVARKLVTSVCGKLRMKPTVSERECGDGWQLERA